MIWVLVIGVVATLALSFMALSGPSASKALKRRIEAVRERHGEFAGTVVQAQIRKLFAQREGRVESFASQFIPKPALLRKRLDQTGRNITLGKYATICGGVFLLTFMLFLFRGMPFLLSLLMGMLVGIGGPHMIVGKMIKRRVNKFNNSFPDAIDLMVRGLRSGLPITETLGIVSGEIPGPVGVEFRLVADRMKIGQTMEAALQETAERLNTAEFQFYVITLAIQRETGGNLAETLSNLSDVLRKRAQMKLKIKAMSSESKASAIIVGSLPFIVFTLVYLLNPDYMLKFFTDPRLIVAGIGGLIWMGLGAFIMAKMVNFEI
jgi:tight adherence protein B